MNSSAIKFGRSKIPNKVTVQGANGGSYVMISGNDTEDKCRVEVGHSCVVTCDVEIPVTWLAAILTHAKDIGFENAMGATDNFPADYALMCNPPAKGD